MDLDRLFLEAAVELAENGRLTCSPNPPVGCLICKDGRVVGRGYHEGSGLPHAEVNAINSIRGGEDQLRGATFYVSLEPCAFEGKTPSCAKTLAKLPISRVVIGAIDPHPKVSGEGIKILRAAGIQVDLIEIDAAVRAIDGFRKRVTCERPLVRLKTASSLDGALSLSDGSSHWITSEASRRDVQYWRARSDAIITGIGTVESDNPRLNVREGEFKKASQPIKVVFDSAARIPLKSEILKSGALTIVAHSKSKEVHRSLSDMTNVQCVGFDGERPSIKDVMSFLGQLDCNEVLVEGGHRLIGAFLRSGVWDEWLAYYAPKILGKNSNSLADIVVSEIADSDVGRIEEVTEFGPDVRLTIRRE